MENVDDSEADTNSEDKDCEEDEHIFFLFLDLNDCTLCILIVNT